MDHLDLIGGDEYIMSTNDEATNSKRSAIRQGYWSDPFIDMFSRGHPRVERKSPEINRGYYARVAAIDMLTKQFLNLPQCADGCQIVNIGCGYDTLFWRIKSNEELSSDLIRSFCDVDFDQVTNKKLFHIRHRPQLLEHLGDDIQFNRNELNSTVYKLISVDLRSTACVQKKLFDEFKLKKELPTLFIAECVLIYMTAEHSNAVLSWISSAFDKCFFVNYEQCNMHDKFSEIMVDNLRQRNCDLLDVESCRDLNTQKERFRTSGWNFSEAWTMEEVYKQGLPRVDIERIEKIEFLDEGNLLEQLLNHYCIVIAQKGLSDELLIGF